MSNLSVKEVKNNVDVRGFRPPTTQEKEEEMNKDLLLRQSRLLYPEVEDWVLNMAIEAYVNELKQNEETTSSLFVAGGRNPLKMPEIN